MLFARLARSLIVALGLAALGTAPARAEDPPVIAAASDLQFALEEVAAQFQADTGQSVTLSFGSTGNLSRQIREGAPFQMFLAADESFVLDLARDGLTRDDGRLYALGRLALIVPKGSPLAADGTLGALKDALQAGSITRFAIANPEHAPYGKRAEEALRHAGLWESLQPHLVLGENVAQAAQFALSGNAEGGIIAHSLALAPELAEAGSFALIPEDWHSPLRQRMVLLPEAGPVAEAFYAYLSTPPARAILDRYGFELPQD
jgi:molybdate transport system substrate-binding protein